MKSVVGKLTCSGFKTGLYISYHGGNAVRYIKQSGYLMKYGRISGYFDTKYMTVLLERTKSTQFLRDTRQISFGFYDLSLYMCQWDKILYMYQ